MSAASPISFPSQPVESPFARGMAFAAYFLLLATLPTFGFGAVLGVIIAYARRDASTPLIRSHHRFQIRIFWIGVALAAAALALGAGAWIDAWREPAPHPLHFDRSPDAQTIAYRPGDDGGSVQPALTYSWSTSGWQGRAFPLHSRAALESYAAMLTVLIGGLWGILTPLWGMARLASGRAMGQSPP